MTGAPTKVNLPLPTVLIPTAPNNQSSPIYYDGTTPQAIMGSVNAGALDLWVGGGGSNGDFKAIFLSQAKQTENEIDLYQQIHDAVLATAAPGEFAVDTAPQGNLLKVSVGWHPPAPTVSSSKNVGAVFVDVFEDRFRPYASEANYAMIYVVGPDGSGGTNGQFKDPADFLDAVERTAEHMVAAVKHYNLNVVPANAGLKTLDTLRVCAYSVGYFNFFGRFKNVPTIASRILQGMATELNKGTGGLKTLELENGHGQFVGLT